MTSFPDDDDGAVLKSLAEAGVDLAQPLEIEFHVAVPDEESGKKIAAAVSAGGYTCELVFDEGEPEGQEVDEEEIGPMWTVYVTAEMVPEHQRIVEIQAELDEFAKPHGGASDGWGVLI